MWIANRTTVEVKRSGVTINSEEAVIWWGTIELYRCNVRKIGWRATNKLPFRRSGSRDKFEYRAIPSLLVPYIIDYSPVSI
jgi:hypothetical protein